MIIAENISKTYHLKKKKNFWEKAVEVKIEAVKEVSLEIPQGKIIGLLGPNGAGKTTIIKILTTMLEPTSGRICIDGLEGNQDLKLMKRCVNLITGGERNIYWRLTAYENLQYFGALYGLQGNFLKNRIEYVLNLVGLKDVQDIPVERFSKGMKQRLQIARGLINNPNYIFLDEPTLGLDIFIAHELREYIKKLAAVEKKGILLTTHYIREAEELCDYIYVIDKGRILLQGTPHGIKEHYSNKFKIKLTFLKNSQEIISKLDEIESVISVKILENYKEEGGNEVEILSNRDIIQDIVSLLSHEKNDILKIVSVDPDLEDVLYSVLQKSEV